MIYSLTYARAFAAWWVVLYHLKSLLPADLAVQKFFALGYLGVDFFFVLSGYILALTHAGEFHRIERGNTRRFYLLRIARIYPLHLVTLLLCLINPILIACCSAQKLLAARYDALDFGLSLLLLQNWGFSPRLSWNVPAWSISTELAAYLLFPLLCVAMHRIARSAHRLLPLVALGLAALLALFYFNAGVASIGLNIPKYGLIRCIVEFALGMVVYRISIDYAGLAGARSAQGWAIGAGLLLLSAGIAGGLADFTFVPIAFALLIGGAGLIRLPAPTGWLGGAAVWMGEVSYATYLIHYIARDWLKFVSPQPTISWTTALVYLLLVAWLSHLLHRFVEVPARRSLRKSFGLDRGSDARRAEAAMAITGVGGSVAKVERS